ncbi:MAG: TetR family transcriptional regulator [Xanthomonadales bacterium]|nr:TetR family transcriptional regulator [Xanthomonadales bacterium]NIN60197.1 TetR family transcriptional regulator [Xanthomonadales bacterium]NIN75563.1 TetR family transcriptional regulator [Xanthomonadales bacterium]NIO12854.1 TetR family transcriptional regulator [Xanthomonadales bacterium]NIP12590.1 TetR family transcriptional regulator [Xanthomonadales bacterium]
MTRLSDTRERILEKATELLTQRGFNGFSYRDISSQLGVRNAAIHYHFASKKDLALALVEEFHRTLRDQTSEFMAYGGRALPQLEGLFVFTERQFCEGLCICPFGAFSVDYDELPEPVRQATDRFMDDSLKWLTRVLETGREQGEFHFQGDAGQRAMGIFATLQGARQMARIHGPAVLGGIIAQIRTDLGLVD